jgi:cytochrome c peroxidase
MTRALPLLVLVAPAAATAGGSREQEELLPALVTPLGRPERAADDSPDALAALGARLFADPLLSADESVSCASCHRSDRGFADERPRWLGVAGRETERNTPTLLNRAFGTRFMWDGRAATLEEQVLLPIENELEMDLPLDTALARLAADTGYRGEFQRVLGGAPDRDGLARALAAFVRRLVLGDSPVDRFRAGDFAALDDAARAGLWFYESRGGCWRCHGGANFTDEEFHNTGVGVEAGQAEPGRAAVTGDPADRGRFKTPTLRGVAHTAPYMHDGSLATLADVVRFYREGGRPNDGLDPLLAPLAMTDADAHNLEAFLAALSRTGAEK